MTGAIACFTLAGILAIGIVWLLIDKAITVIGRWRERRAAFIRNEQLRKYCITPWINKERQ